MQTVLGNNEIGFLMWFIIHLQRQFLHMGNRLTRWEMQADLGTGKAVQPQITFFPHQSWLFLSCSTLEGAKIAELQAAC